LKGSVEMKKSINRDKALFAYLCILVPITYFSVFWFYPIFNALFTSLYRWEIITPMRYTGFGNYLKLMKDPRFVRSLYNTFYYILLYIAPAVSISLLLALLFNRKFPFRGLFRTIYFIPYVTSILVICVLWKTIYHPSFGLLAGVTQRLGLPSLNWLHDLRLAMPAIGLMNIWKSVGFLIILFLGGLQTIPKILYEAAAVDGANKWLQFRHITLPLLKPTVLFVLVISLINAFQMFIPVFQMTKGGPLDRTLVIALYTYRNAFQFYKMGYACSMAIIMLMMVLGLSFIQMRLFRSK